MQIARDSVVQFHYSVAEPGQPEIESSRGGEPIAALIGHRNLMAGLDQAMMGHVAGDRFEVTISPEDGYGPRREDATQRVPKKHFRDAMKLKPGMQTVLPTSQGPRPVTVLKVGASVVDVDLNHPMAGKTLTFNVEIIDVRAGNEEEIAHGHAHAPGGHQH